MLCTPGWTWRGGQSWGAWGKRGNSGGRVSISGASGGCTPITPLSPHAMPHRPIIVSNMEYPRPAITPPTPGRDHSTVINGRIWKIGIRLRLGAGVSPRRLADRAVSGKSGEVQATARVVQWQNGG